MTPNLHTFYSPILKSLKLFPEESLKIILVVWDRPPVSLREASLNA
jgi:hypothetical protein